MQLLDQQVIFTPADLTDCEFALVQRVTELRGLLPATAPSEFLRERRRAAMTDMHQRIGAEYFRKYSRMFTTLDSPAPTTLSELQAAAAESAELLRTLRVVAGATLLAPAPGDTAGPLLAARPAVALAGTVAHAVLERFTRAGDLTELGAHAYAAQIVTDREVGDAYAHLNNGRRHKFDGTELAAIAAPRITHVAALVAEANSRPDPWPWGTADIVACGFCPWCRAAATNTRDTQLVWGVRRASRHALGTAGITTVAELARAQEPRGVDRFTWSRLQTRAQLQLHYDDTGEHATHVHNPAALAALPEPSEGDIFFDFEGDPLWVEKNRYEWGLEFLFGYTEADTGTYTALWATTQAEEKRSFTTFLDYLTARRATHPDMHVYHFGFYEPQTLRRLARRHRVGQREVNEFLAAGLFVDLYETFKAGVHFSGRSYGLKALEPLYMGEDLRTGDVLDGEAAVAQFTAGQHAKKKGEDAAWERTQALIADYNRYDCLSTQRLRDWLLAHRPTDPHELALDLLGGTPLHGDLLLRPLEEPAEDFSALPLVIPEFDEPGIFYLASGSSTDALGAEHKTHELLGRWGSGTAFAPGTDVLVVYSDPATSPTDATGLLARRAEILTCDWAGDLQRITLRETTPAHDPTTNGLSPSYLTTAVPAAPAGPVMKTAKRAEYWLVTGPPGSGTSAAAADLAAKHRALLIDDAHSVSLADAAAQIGAAEEQARAHRAGTGGHEPVRVVVAGDPTRARPTPPRAQPEDLAAASVLSWLGGTSGATITHTLPLDTTTRFHRPLATTLQKIYPRAVFQPPASPTRVLAEEFTGLHVRYVDHRGNRDASREEAESIVRLVARVLESSPVDPSDILITAGSHNQALLLRSFFEQGPNVRVVPHDELDGHEAALVIFSLGVSTFADLPGARPVEPVLPFAPHVVASALSRAREGVIVVCSTHLFTQPLPRANQVPALGALLSILA